jgi:hypothetical protein
MNGAFGTIERRGRKHETRRSYLPLTRRLCTLRECADRKSENIQSTVRLERSFALGACQRIRKPETILISWRSADIGETARKHLPITLKHDETKCKQKEREREREISWRRRSPFPSSARIGALARVHGAQLDVISTKTHGRANYFSPSDFRSRPLCSRRINNESVCVESVQNRRRAWYPRDSNDPQSTSTTIGSRSPRDGLPNFRRARRASPSTKQSRNNHPALVSSN